MIPTVQAADNPTRASGRFRHLHSGAGWLARTAIGAIIVALLSMLASHILDEFTHERSRKAYWDGKVRDVVEDVAFVLNPGAPAEGMSAEERALGRNRVREAQAGFEVLRHGPLGEMPGLREDVSGFLNRVDDRVNGTDTSDDYPELRDDFRRLHRRMVECLVAPEPHLLAFALQRIGLGRNDGPGEALDTCDAVKEIPT